MRRTSRGASTLLSFISSNKKASVARKRERKTSHQVSECSFGWQPVAQSDGSVHKRTTPTHTHQCDKTGRHEREKIGLEDNNRYRAIRFALTKLSTSTSATRLAQVVHRLSAVEMPGPS